MGYLPDPKTTTIFVTASTLSLNGRKRKIIVEARPEFAILNLDGSKERFSLAWESIYEAAAKHDIESRTLELEATKRTLDTTFPNPSVNRSPAEGMTAKKVPSRAATKALKSA